MCNSFWCFILRLLFRAIRYVCWCWAFLGFNEILSQTVNDILVGAFNNDNVHLTWRGFESSISLYFWNVENVIHSLQQILYIFVTLIVQSDDLFCSPLFYIVNSRQIYFMSYKISLKYKKSMFLDFFFSQ